MTPLAELISVEMQRHGWSVDDVVDRGLPYSTLHNLRNRELWKMPPRPATLQKIADVFSLRIERVQKAADDSVDRAYQREDNPRAPAIADAVTTYLDSLPEADREPEARRLAELSLGYLPDGDWWLELLNDPRAQGIAADALAQTALRDLQDRTGGLSNDEGIGGAVRDIHSQHHRDS